MLYVVEHHPSCPKKMLGHHIDVKVMTTKHTIFTRTPRSERKRTIVSGYFAGGSRSGGIRDARPRGGEPGTQVVGVV
jgi:hypothetical protein